jgi:hypothetical protein
VASFGLKSGLRSIFEIALLAAILNERQKAARKEEEEERERKEV